MTVNTETLLDKLYNLRGADSDILKEMDRQKAKAEATKARTTDEKANLQKNIADLKKQRKELEEQGDKFKEVLGSIHREDYETVLSKLNVDFDPKGLLEKVEKNLPKTIETVEKDTKKAEDELVKVEEEMNGAITAIEELGIRKDAALANQDKLNEYFELALTGHINITRDSITSLLQDFGFNEAEQRETAKILMFPEDALFQYDEKVKGRARVGKSISEVLQEAKTMVDEEPDEIDDIKVPTFDIDTEFSIEEPKEESVDIKTEVIETLKEKGIDYLDFTSDEINKLIDNFDKDLVIKNIDFMKSTGFASDVYINHIDMMYDKELVDKVKLLLASGKEVLDIYLNPKVLVKYNLAELQKSIDTMKNNGMDPKEVPLMAY
uniref:hypothetical protein n=1 Tax=Candidatus Ventrenecus sp. TaxID=3085654 RepID=UPI004027648D